MNDCFELDAADGIAHLRLNRAERMNTLAPARFPLLRHAVQGLSDAGETRALVISSTGKHFSAGMALDVFAGTDLALGTGTSRALDLGLVNAVPPDAAALLAHTMGVARTIAVKSPLVIAGTKLDLNHARDHRTAAALEQMTLLQSAIVDPAEMAEAIGAWRDKRADALAPLAPVAGA